MTAEQHSISRIHPHDPSSGGALRGVVRVWRRRWTFLLALSACLASGFAYWRFAKPLYTATSRLYVEEHEPRLLGDGREASQQSDSFVYAQAEALTSRPVISQALEKLPVATMQAFAQVKDPALYLKKRLDVQVGKKDAGVAVSFDAPTPAEATAVVKAIVDAYMDQQSRRQRSTANDMLKLLQEEKRTRDAELAQKAAEVLAFKKANPSLSLDGGGGKGNIILERLGRLSENLTAAELQAFEAHSQYTAAKAASEEPGGTRYICSTVLATDKEYQDLLADLHRLELSSASLNGRGYLNSPPAHGLQIALTEAQEQVAAKEKQAVAGYLKGLEQKWQEARGKEEEIRRSLVEQQAEAADLNGKLVEYARLQSEQARLEKLCEAPERQITEMRLAGGASGLNVHILEPAAARNVPTHPDPIKVMAFAAALGLLLGTGLALLRDGADAPLRSADEITTALGIPVLGVVPRIVGKQDSRGRSIVLEPDSEVAEAYRAISMSVFFFLPHGKAKTILITSPEPGDGKTTAASNVAIALAQAGYRTLLLDADCRRPSQHKVFELGQSVGLLEVISGACSLGQAIHPTAIPRLEVLPCGAIPPSASEVLNGRPFAELMKTLAKEYEKIVIDSPPLLPVIDARLLAGFADATVLVLRADKSTRRASMCSRDGLLSVGANVVGVVVNDVPLRGRRRYDYYYSYRFTPGDDERAGPKTIVRELKSQLALPKPVAQPEQQSQLLG